MRAFPLAGLALVAALLALAPAGLRAQTADQTADQTQAPAAPLAKSVTLTPGKTVTAGQTAGTKTIQLRSGNSGDLDYVAWEQTAQRAEGIIAEGTISNAGLELLRNQLVDWRSRFQTAETANDSRIATLRDQITALGEPPAEGATEPEEIAARRKELNAQLAAAEAPGKTAVEAYRRANGLIVEIDRVVRERAAAQMLKLWPTPVNPANWGDAVGAVSSAALRIAAEIDSNWRRPDRRAAMVDALPVIGVLFLLAFVMIWRGRVWIERLAQWLHTSSGAARWRRVFAFLASLGQVVVPSLGVALISIALTLTDMTIGLSDAVVRALAPAGFVLFLAIWLAGRVFPKTAGDPGPLALTPEQSAEARFHTAMIGLVLALETLREALLPAAQQVENAVPVLSLPLIVVMGLLLWRVGHLLNRHLAVGEGDEANGFRNHVMRLFGKVLIAIAVVGPVLALIGYTSAAASLVFPAAASVGLTGLLVVLVQLISDIYRAIIRAEDDAQGLGQGQGQGLLPVLAGFVLTLASLPLFALIWGARVEELDELWNRFTQGFMVGETRISPSNFLYFLILFAIGLTLTRLFQGALRSSILPKTKLDQGGRNAIVSGTGYIGIFIAGVVAFSGAGIDLSGLAIVASALSLGIGFGLQNIVQNFVSGVILLIERPVSEGDWIEVGGVSGTVKAISVRSTRIQTFDRSDVIVPNADLVSQRVTNWTRFSLSGRVIIPVGVDYSSDTRKVARVLQDIAEAQPLAILNPPPVVAFMGLGADAMNFEIRMIIRDVNFSLAVRTEVNHQIVQRFHEEGISMPFSQRDIWLRNPDAVAHALAALATVQAGGTLPEPGPELRGNTPPPALREPADPLDDETER